MKTKRLVAPLMAPVMIVGLFAMTASAAVSCVACHSTNGRFTPTSSWTTSGGTRTEGCGYHSGTHYHYYAARSGSFKCSSCGKTLPSTETNPDYCPYS